MTVEDIQMATNRSIIIDQLQDTERFVANSLSGAQKYLCSCFKTDNSNPARTLPMGGWSQFTNEEDRVPNTSGTACGLISLIACGENTTSEYIVRAKLLLTDRIRTDGGWSTSTLQGYCSTTRMTCLAMWALLDSGEPVVSDYICRGTAWLVQAQNADGGWGEIARDGKSDVTSTALSIQNLVGTTGLHAGASDAILRGKRWLFEVQNLDNSWGLHKGLPGSLSYTSHAVEALLATGMHRSTLEPSREWLLTNVSNDVQFMDSYTVAVPGSPIIRLVWTNVSRERALKALVKLNVDIASPALSESLDFILKRQVNNTYWDNATMPNTAATWAMMEATTSLRSYLNYFSSAGSLTLLREMVSDLREQVDEQEKKIARLETQMSERVFKVRMHKFLKFIIRPLPLIVSLTFLTVLLYILFRSQLNLPTMADTIAGALGIGGLGVSVYQILADAKQKGRLTKQ
jgi:hypothetical protein